MTRARSRRTARRKIKRLIRKTLKIVCAVWDFIARHPAMLAMPLIIFLLVLTIQMFDAGVGKMAYAKDGRTGSI